MFNYEENTKKIIREKVIEIIRKNDKYSSGSIQLTDDKELQSFGLDSINFVHLVVELEIVFDIEFEDEDLMIKKFRTIGEIYSIIKEKLKDN